MSEQELIKRLKELKEEGAILGKDEVKTILNLVEKQDKIIDLMAKEMKNKEYEYEDMCLYSEDCHGEYCEHCIKEYFRKKVENE